MAITQQLASIPADFFLRARNDVNALIQLLHFIADIPSEYLDLNWYPEKLVKRFKNSKHTDIANCLEQLFGEVDPEILNPKHPRGEEFDQVYSDVTYLTPVQAKSISVKLESVGLNELEDVFSGFATGLKNSPNRIDYEHAYFRLRAFLSDAAHQSHYVVAWWD